MARWEDLLTASGEIVMTVDNVPVVRRRV